MPVTLGQTPDAGFDQPLKLLCDCHRRIEKFLDLLIRVADECPGGPLEPEYRDALQAALRYFQNAAPWHTRDEEDSLFPRLRRLDDPRARAVMARIDSLEDDHAQAEARHAQSDLLGRQWLTDDALGPAGLSHLRRLLVELRDTYRRHIAEEDDVIFPLAGELLDQSQLDEVGFEMAQRRGIDPVHPSPRCRHARNRKTHDRPFHTPASPGDQL